jgi:large subunit ribosomal protein L27
MAHTKSQKTVSGNRDSRSKRLGVKIFGGQKVKTGNIIVRQKGTKFYAGDGVLKSRDFTLVALKNGIVEFKIVKGKKYVFIN